MFNLDLDRSTTSRSGVLGRFLESARQLAWEIPLNKVSLTWYALLNFVHTSTYVCGLQVSGATSFCVELLNQTSKNATHWTQTRRHEVPSPLTVNSLSQSRRKRLTNTLNGHPLDESDGWFVRNVQTMITPESHNHLGPRGEGEGADCDPSGVIARVSHQWWVWSVYRHWLGHRQTKHNPWENKYSSSSKV